MLREKAKERERDWGGRKRDGEERKRDREGRENKCEK